jgi:hypothetical protein
MLMLIDDRSPIAVHTTIASRSRFRNFVVLLRTSAFGSRRRFFFGGKNKKKPFWGDPKINRPQIEGHHLEIAQQFRGRFIFLRIYFPKKNNRPPTAPPA